MSSPVEKVDCVRQKNRGGGGLLTKDSTKTCVTCGGSMEGFHGAKKACSAACEAQRQIAVDNRRNEQSRMRGTWRQCTKAYRCNECGGGFTARKHQPDTWSQVCNPCREAKFGRNSPCAICGKSVGRIDRTYCSTECKSMAFSHRKWNRDRHKGVVKELRDIKTCAKKAIRKRKNLGG